MAVDVSPAQPPLTRWAITWRMLLCVLISTVAWVEVAIEQWQTVRWWFWADLAVGLLSFGVVQLRRRWPLGVAVALTIAGMFSLSTAGPATLAGVSMATRRRWAEIVPVGILSVATAQAYTSWSVTGDEDAAWLVFTFAVAITIAMLAIGMYVGSHRDLMWSLRERARHAEAEQGLRVGQARSAERERIAREMHDVLAHKISLVTMHAGALAFRDDLPPEQVRETAALIQETSHAALADLRQVLGMLREGDVGYRPQPSLADVPALVEEARGAGITVELRDRLTTAPPDQVGRTAYRIVQEALTNARKHGGPKAYVELAGAPGEGLTVVVRNGRRFGAADQAPASGFGLVGLRERAELAGGRIEVEETREAFTLHGWLPWPR